MTGAAMRRGRLDVRFQRPETTGTSGLYRLGPEDDRDGLLLVPGGYIPERPTPLLVMLHGAGGSAQHGLSYVLEAVEPEGMILLAPESRGQTWDIIASGYGPDVELINRLLGEVFSRYTVDPRHLAIGGFSDGASYALSLGVANGDFFTHIIAFAPGSMAPMEIHGKPRIFIAHGKQDAVLPIDRCSRRIVPQLRERGYDTAYHEFEGGHSVPAGIARVAVTWFLG